jgi:hypothetical protein
VPVPNITQVATVKFPQPANLRSLAKIASTSGIVTLLTNALYGKGKKCQPPDAIMKPVLCRMKVAFVTKYEARQPIKCANRLVGLIEKPVVSYS